MAKDETIRGPLVTLANGVTVQEVSNSTGAKVTLFTDPDQRDASVIFERVGAGGFMRPGLEVMDVRDKDEHYGFGAGPGYRGTSPEGVKEKVEIAAIPIGEKLKFTVKGPAGSETVRVT